jgi:hypothetical protein
MSHPREHEAAERPVGIFKLRDAIKPEFEVPPIPRLTWRIGDIATALGISRRAIERERSAGRLPQPDTVIGRMPLWKPETIRAWIEGGGRP